jgi:5-methylcytosine-specific restriction endonuclease McrA
MAGRIGGEKTRCSGKWTEAKFRSFIKSNLRRTSMKWGPLNEARKLASTRRGFYLCSGCKEEIPASIKIDRVRKNNVHVDHIKPVVDPVVGWVSWDDTIEGMFSELPNLQVLCTACHDKKTNEERDLAKTRREQEKLNDE